MKSCRSVAHTCTASLPLKHMLFSCSLPTPLYDRLPTVGYGFSLRMRGCGLHRLPALPSAKPSRKQT